MTRHIIRALALAALLTAPAHAAAPDPQQEQTERLKQMLGTLVLAYYSNGHCPAFALTDATVLRVQMDVLMRQARSLNVNDAPEVFTTARDQALKVRCDDQQLAQQVMIARRLTFDALGAWLVLAEDLMDAGLGPKDMEPSQELLVRDTVDLYHERLKENLTVEQWRVVEQRRRARFESVNAAASRSARSMVEAADENTQRQGQFLARQILSERTAATEIAWAMVVDTQVREQSGKGLRADPIDTGWVSYRPGPATDTASWWASHVSNCRHLAVDCEFVLVVGDSGNMQASVSPRLGSDQSTIYVPRELQILIRNTESTEAPTRETVVLGRGADQEALTANTPSPDDSKVAEGIAGPAAIPPPAGLPVRPDASHFALGSQLLPELRALHENDVIVMRVTYEPSGGGDPVTADLRMPVKGLERALYWARVGTQTGQQEG